MARPLRYQAAGAIYHVMARGEGGKNVFETDQDRSSWLERLGQACEKHGWLVHAWVLMGNHYHLLVETPQPNLVAGMKWLMGVFSQGWNIRRGRRGHVFQGRYKSVVVNGEGKGEYFRIVADYIHLNPVRSGWVGGTTGKRLAHWKWSSFHQYAGRRGHAWLETGKVLGAIDLDRGGRGKRTYAAYLEARAKDRKGVLNDESLNALRNGWYLGDDSFRDRLLDNLRSIATGAGKTTSRSNLSGRAIRDQDEVEAERLIRRVSEELGVDPSPGKLVGRGRLLEEKAILAWFVRSRTGVSNEWLSKRLATGHPSGVSKAVRRVTDDNRLLRRAKRITKVEEKGDNQYEVEEES